VSRKSRRPSTRVDVSSWRKHVLTPPSVCLHDENQLSHVVTVQSSPPRPVFFLDSLSLPYADDSLTTTPVDPPPTPPSASSPSTSGGRHVSTSGRRCYDWSAGDSSSTSTETGSGGAACDVTPPPRSPEIDDDDDDENDESRDVCGPMTSLAARVTSLRPLAAASTVAAVAVARGSVDGGRRPSIGPLPASVQTTSSPRTMMSSVLRMTSHYLPASVQGLPVPVFRSTVASESLRRCEPTHFHWTSTSTSARARPSLRPAIVDSIIVSSLVSFSSFLFLHIAFYC